jgi:WD40 repeat protein
MTMRVNLVYWHQIGAYNAAVDSATIAADSETFAAITDGRPVLMQRDGQRMALPAEVYTEKYVSAALSADGLYLALASAQSLQIIDLSSGKVTRAPVGGFYHVAWRSDGQSLATSRANNTASFWNLRAECVDSISLPARKQCWQVAFSQNGEQVFAVSIDLFPNWVCVHQQGKPVSKARLPDGRYVSALASWDEGFLVAMSDNASHFELAAYSPTLQMVKQVKLRSPITVLATVPSKDWLAAGTVEGIVCILSTETLQVTDQRTLWTAPVRTLAASEQDCVLAGANDGRLALIELVE